jgi:hypothetical protein
MLKTDCQRVRMTDNPTHFLALRHNQQTNGCHQHITLQEYNTHIFCGVDNVTISLKYCIFVFVLSFLREKERQFVNTKTYLFFYFIIYIHLYFYVTELKTFLFYING